MRSNDGSRQCAIRLILVGKIPTGKLSYTKTSVNIIRTDLVIEVLKELRYGSSAPECSPTTHASPTADNLPWVRVVGVHCNPTPSSSLLRFISGNPRYCRGGRSGEFLTRGAST